VQGMYVRMYELHRRIHIVDIDTSRQLGSAHQLSSRQLTNSLRLLLPTRRCSCDDQCITQIVSHACAMMIEYEATCMRRYFMFGPPIQTDASMATERNRTQEVHLPCTSGCDHSAPVWHTKAQLPTPRFFDLPNQRALELDLITSSCSGTSVSHLTRSDSG
jgi:hypothetical protein